MTEIVGNQYDKIGPALVAAMAEIPAIPKNAQAYGYKYATLDDILSAVKPVLAEHNLVLLQPLSGDGLETIIMHESGQCIRNVVALPQMSENKKMNAAQAVGATITYFRRYALSSILGISNDEDTDGAVGKKATTKPTRTPDAHRPTATKEQANFSGFKSAAEVKNEQHKTQVIEAEHEEVMELMADELKEELKNEKESAEDPAPTPIPKAAVEATPVIDWDTEVRLQADLCTKKQASYIFSLGQRSLGQDFEMEDLTGFTNNEGVPEEEFVSLDAKAFCGSLSKRNATKVINVLQELAGIETKP